MPKQIKIPTIKTTDRHIRWNWEASPDRQDAARSHYVIVDNKRREGTFESIVDQFQQFSAIEIVRTCEGKVEGSPHRYLLNSFDANVSTREIDKTLFKLPTVRDKNLYERHISSIEEYVMKLYSK